MEYYEFLNGLNMTESQINDLMFNLDDPALPELPTIYPIFSEIQGIGLASVFSYQPNEYVLTALDDGVRQIGSRYTNHSKDPNTVSVIWGADIVMLATRAIEAGEELTMCYANNVKVSEEYTNLTKGTL